MGREEGVDVKSKPTEMELSSAVKRLCVARAERLEAKREVRAIAVAIGSCEGVNTETWEGVRCYYSEATKDKWCSICKAKLPLWEDYHKKANIAAAALRSLLRLGKRLP